LCPLSWRDPPAFRTAEGQGHHPDIYLAWSKVVLEVWTHKIDGLVEKDFIFAAKADVLNT